MLNKTKSLYKKHPRTGLSIVILLAISMFFIGLRFALSPGIIYGTTSWLKSQGISSSIEDLHFNILDGSVSLVNAKGLKDGNLLFNVNLIELHWQWTPLSNRVIDVTEVVIDGFSVDIALFTDRIIISGIEIPIGQHTTAADEIQKEISEEDTSWAASLGKVTFTNLDICYLQHSASYSEADNNNKILDYCSNLDEMTWSGSIQYGTDELLMKEEVPVSSTGDFTLSGLTVIDNKLNKTVLSSADNTVTQVTINGLNDIQIAELDMRTLSMLQRDDKKHKDAVRFQQLTINDISLRDLSALRAKTITIDEPGFYLVKHGESNWEYQQWLPSFPVVAETSSSSTPSSNTPGSNTADDDKQATENNFNLAIDTINIKSADLCYLDDTTSIYYCVTFSAMDWDGKIHYETDIALHGDLLITDPLIRNFSIERNLLAVQSVSLTGLDMKGIDLVTLDKIIVNKLTALQRSEDDSDNTVSVNGIDVEKLRYTGDNISINTITVDGLADTLSINKDGSWEHDKWLIKTAAVEPDGETAGAERPERPENSDTPPMGFSLDKLTLNTDKPIIFIDNSTSPVMKLGLQKLSFEADRIYSRQPDNDTSFKIAARTIRHSTIDIAGTARPFADKISFAAKGELKGLDLRAATPATKKAIGHIIQSGQMDADLDLLATDGVLDSEVKLVLYHFNIKAVSSKDAAKLDKQFGMPLNQTLVLLRDKDDTIKLTVPITGDVNNPDFDPTNAIIATTSKAAAVTLITFYTPYGLAYAGGNLAFNLATALHFDPIKFAAGSDKLDGDNREQLDNLSKLMTAKPGIHLTLCGITNQQDVRALFPEYNKMLGSTGSEDDEHADVAQVKLSDKQLATLKQIAKQRQVNSKNYMVSQDNIDHARLILCAPEHKPDIKEYSGVEISI